MPKRRETMVLLITAVIVVIVLGAMYFNVGWGTQPVAPDEQQNTGTDAPNETAPPLGVVDDGAQAGSDADGQAGGDAGANRATSE